jgi:hypothetical protein
MQEEIKRKAFYLISLCSCEMSGSHGGEYDDNLVGYNAVKCGAISQNTIVFIVCFSPEVNHVPWLWKKPEQNDR